MAVQTIKAVAMELGLSEDKVRRRLKLLREAGLDGCERGRNNALLLSPEIVEVLQRVVSLEKAGFSPQQAVWAVLAEVGRSGAGVPQRIGAEAPSSTTEAAQTVRRIGTEARSGVGALEKALSRQGWALVAVTGLQALALVALAIWVATHR